MIDLSSFEDVLADCEVHVEDYKTDVIDNREADKKIEEKRQLITIESEVEKSEHLKSSTAKSPYKKSYRESSVTGSPYKDPYKDPYRNIYVNPYNKSGYETEEAKKIRIQKEIDKEFDDLEEEVREESKKSEIRRASKWDLFEVEERKLLREMKKPRKVRFIKRAEERRKLGLKATIICYDAGLSFIRAVSSSFKIIADE